MGVWLSRVVTSNRHDGRSLAAPLVRPLWLYARVADMLSEAFSCFAIGLCVFALTSLASSGPWESALVTALALLAAMLVSNTLGAWSVGMYSSTTLLTQTLLGYVSVLRAALLLVAQLGGYTLAAYSVQRVLPASVPLALAQPTAPLLGQPNVSGKLVFIEYVLCMLPVLASVLASRAHLRRVTTKRVRYGMGVASALAVAGATGCSVAAGGYLGTGGVLNSVRALAGALVVGRYAHLGHYVAGHVSAAAAMAFIMLAYDMIYVFVALEHSVLARQLKYIDASAGHRGAALLERHLHDEADDENGAEEMRSPDANDDPSLMHSSEFMLGR